MGGTSLQRASRGIWGLARRQHGVLSRGQLLDAGITPRAIEHRLARGRLHPVRRGVYAVGRPEIDQRGRWMAALLACGTGAALSHRSAAALWDIISSPSRNWIEVTVPPRRAVNRAGIKVHRRDLAPHEIRRRDHVPLTSPSLTLVDLATVLGGRQLEAAVNAADKVDLVDPEGLRAEIGEMPRRPGLARLKALLDEATFWLTDSELERRFLRLVRAARLPIPLTQQSVSGYRVDFYWPEHSLVVETDGLRYHRTATQQAKDLARDQAHLSAGLMPLRFSHRQVRHDPGEVASTLARALGR